VIPASLPDDVFEVWVFLAVVFAAAGEDLHSAIGKQVHLGALSVVLILHLVWWWWWWWVRWWRWPIKEADVDTQVNLGWGSIQICAYREWLSTEPLEHLVDLLGGLGQHGGHRHAHDEAADAVQAVQGLR
jgi:hypothetical protein